MELKSILNTSAIRVVREIQSPQVFLPDLARAVAERYRFVKYPQTIEDYTKESMEFSFGSFFESAIISKLVIYNSGFMAEAPTDSGELDKFLDDLTELLENLGVQIPASNILCIYGSTLEFQMKPGFGEWFEQFRPIVDAIRNSVEDTGIAVSDYQVGGFTVVGEGPDAIKPPRFVLERRAGEPLESNVFYSQAPLSTERHMGLLTKIESLYGA